MEVSALIVSAVVPVLKVAVSVVVEALTVSLPTVKFDQAFWLASPLPPSPSPPPVLSEAYSSAVPVLFTFRT